MTLENAVIMVAASKHCRTEDTRCAQCPMSSIADHTEIGCRFVRMEGPLTSEEAEAISIVDKVEAELAKLSTKEISTV